MERESDQPDRAARLGQRLQALRLRRGWDMDRVALAAGVSRTTVFHLERGEIARPRASTLHKLAVAFAIPVEDLAADDWTCGAGSGAPQLAPRVSAQESTHESMDGRTAETGTGWRDFDRATNPAISALAAEEPALFQGWGAEDWDQLYSTFATGGALRSEGVRDLALRINSHRDTVARLQMVLQTHLAEAATRMIDQLFRLISDESPAALSPEPASAAQLQPQQEEI